MTWSTSEAFTKPYLAALDSLHTKGARATLEALGLPAPRADPQPTLSDPRPVLAGLRI